MNRKLLVMAGVGVAVVGGVGWFAAEKMFLREYREIRDETRAYEKQTKSFSAGAKGARAIKVGLRDAGRTMLGGEQNVVEHRLRGMVSELAERNGLREIVVSHSRPRVAANPADERGSGISRSLRRRLGDQTDFAVIRGRVQGLGSLDQVVRTLADLRAQPWLHRVEGFTIEPKGKERAVFEVKADFATLFAPDLIESDGEPPVLVAASEDDVRELGAIAARAPFRFADPVPTPEPVEIVKKPEKATPPPPPAPPYDKWRVTGVMELLERAPGGESGGVEVFLARVDTGETQVLRVGQSVLGATLRKASGERAWFEKDGALLVVRAGETLAQARPSESVHSDAAGAG